MVTEPADPGIYYTNYGGTNLVISGNANLTSLIGPSILLTWQDPGKPVWLQTSPDLITWTDLRITHIGGTNWWIWPWPGAQSQFFRLRSLP